MKRSTPFTWIAAAIFAVMAIAHIYRLIQPRNEGGDALEAGNLAVRDGDAVSQAGRTQRLAIGDRIGNFVRIMPGDFCRPLGKFFKQLAFRYYAGAAQHGTLSQDIGQFH